MESNALFGVNKGILAMLLIDVEDLIGGGVILLKNDFVGVFLKSQASGEVKDGHNFVECLWVWVEDKLGALHIRTIKSDISFFKNY